MQRILITGASSGLGRAFAEAALAAGHAVTGTVRKSGDSKTFEALHPTRAKAVVLDVAHFDKAAPTVGCCTTRRRNAPTSVRPGNAFRVRPHMTESDGLANRKIRQAIAR